MKTSTLLGALTVLALALGASTLRAAEEQMAVANGTVAAGDGQSITLKGSPLPLTGKAIKVGDTLPSATLTGTNMAPVNIADAKGKVRIISVVPSVDTPTCDAQTHELAEKDAAISQNVDLVTVSMDLPFAQGRFAKSAKIKNVTFLSDYKTGEFGMNTGLMIQPLHLLARSLIVTDKNNVVRYIQIVPEVTELPDMIKAMEFAKTLL